MDGIPTSPTPAPAGPARRKQGASGPPRAKSRKSAGGGRSAVARRVLVIGVAAGVFVTALILDTGAVARLLWACLKGQAGEPARLAAGAVVLLLLGATALVVYRPAPPAKPRKRASRPAIRADATAEGPDKPPRTRKRGGKRAAQAVTDRSV